MRRALATLVLAAACGGPRHVVIESSRPAKVFDWSGRVVCEATPCDWLVSRETCGLFDSSSGFVLLRARAQDGAEAVSPPVRTCEVREGEHLRLVFSE